MSFDIGDKVKIVRRKGEKGYYHNGKNLSDIPLGTRGIVMDSGGYVTVSIEGKHEYFLTEELDYDKTIKGINPEQKSKLENLLSLQEPAEKVELTTQEPAEKVELTKSHGVIFEKLRGLLGYFSKRSYSEDNASINVKERTFEPRFNVREEFAVWVKEQFPKLKEHCINEEDYEELESRRDEVYRAALAACHHGVQTIQNCANRKFENLLCELMRKRKGCNYKFYQCLNHIVSSIEKFSVNLNVPENRHYGTRLAKARK